jgi:hypothetical protein
MSKQYERFKREKERFKPSLDVAQSLMPEVAYRARKSGVQLGYLEVTVQEKLRSGWPGPFVKVEGCCD